MEKNKVTYKIKTATENQILAHLKECNESFLPPLAERVDIAGYSRKIFEKSITFEAWKEGALVGLLAVYLNKGAESSAYITNVSVSKFCMGAGIASVLLQNCVEYAIEQGCGGISLEVHKANRQALGLYQKFDFIITDESKKEFLRLRKDLGQHDRLQKKL